MTGKAGHPCNKSLISLWFPSTGLLGLLIDYDRHLEIHSETLVGSSVTFVPQYMCVTY